MSWFTRSIANNFNLEEEENKLESEEDNSPQSPSQGIKQDISEITKTLSQQFWGVASFLAPPPEQEKHADPDSDPEKEVDPVLGIRRDIEELGGRFRSGISKLSSNIDVSKITKLASNLFQADLLDGEAEVVGVTEDVLSFVRDVTLHPETWLDFPLYNDEEDNDSDGNVNVKKVVCKNKVKV